jgi:predicted metal-dependent phosphoesterase TrpH
MENGMLKCDFHAHSNEDDYDTLMYTAEQLIDEYARQNFDVVAITLHGKVHFPHSLQEYAHKKGILLIPGAEGFVEGKHVLFLNVSQHEVSKLKSIEDIILFRKQQQKSHFPVLVIAVHPFYPGKAALNEVLERNPDCFDAIEYSHYYLKKWNKYNEKAKAFAHKYNKPLLGMGDVHTLFQVGYTYTLLKAKKDPFSIIRAIKEGSGEVKSMAIPFWTFVRLTLFYWPCSAWLDPKKWKLWMNRHKKKAVG